MPLYDLTEFLKLSSVLNYNLSAASLNRYNVMMYIIGGKTLDRSASKDKHKIKDPHDQRHLLLESMDYCFSGRIDLVTKPDRDQLLDGLFSTYFAPNSKKVLHQQLDILYQNKPLMIQAEVNPFNREQKTDIRCWSKNILLDPFNCLLSTEFCPLFSDSSDFQVAGDVVIKTGQSHGHEVIDNFEIMES